MSNTYAQMLVERRQKTWDAAKAMLDKAADEKRDLTVEEQTAYDQMNADLNDLRSQVDKLLEADKSAAETEETLRKLMALPVDESRGGARNDSARDFDEEFRKLYRREANAVELEITKSQAIGMYSKRSRAAMMAEEDRVLSVGTATAGGATVPTSFYNQLVRHLITDSAIMAAGATVLHTSSGENLQIPTTTAYTTGALVAEAGTIAESDPAFVLRTLGAFKYAALVTTSRELLDDSAFALVPFVADQAGEGITNTFGTDLVVGNGSSKPRGVLQDSTLGKTGATSVAGVPTMDDLIDLYYSVIPKYRRNASWLMADASAAAIRKFKTSGSGDYIWQPSVIAGQPDRLLNSPVYSDPNVPAMAIAAKSVVFGDMSRYFVRLVNSIRFERSDDFHFDTDQVTFRCLIRGDGMLVDRTGAVKHFLGGAS